MNKAQKLLSKIKEQGDGPTGWYVVGKEDSTVADGPYDSKPEAEKAMKQYGYEDDCEVEYGKSTDNGYFITVKK